MQQPNFSRPSSNPAFQEQLKPKDKEMLSTLLGEPSVPAPEQVETNVEGGQATKKSTGRALRAVPKKPAKEERVKEDRSHRTTVWLSPTLQRKIHIRALERDQTISAYLRYLLAKDGIVDDES